MRQSKTRKNFFKPRYNLVLKTKSVLWSNMFKMRKVIKKRKWRSVFFNFRTFKILEPSIRTNKLSQRQNAELLYNPFSIFSKKNFKLTDSNNLIFFKNKTRIMYLNWFLNLSNILFSKINSKLNLNIKNLNLNLVKKIQKIIFNLENKNFNTFTFFKKINYFFNFFIKSLEFMKNKKNLSKFTNFKKFAVIRKTNNFKFFVNYRDYIENEVINSVFFSRGRFRNTKNPDDSVFINKMSSIFVNSYSIKLTKLKVIRNFYAIRSLKKIKRMLIKSNIQGKRFLLQQKFSQKLLLKTDTVVHNLGWSNSILDSKNTIKNNEIFINNKMINFKHHTLKPGDIITLKKNRLNIKQINIDPRIKKLSNMKRNSRKYIQLFRNISNKFKNGYKPTGTSIWYFFKRNLAFKNKYLLRTVRNVIHKNLNTKKIKKVNSKRPRYSGKIFLNKDTQDIAQHLRIFRSNKSFRNRNKKFSFRFWPIFLFKKRSKYLFQLFNQANFPKHYIHKFDQRKKQRKLIYSGKIIKYNNSIDKIQIQYKRFFTKYPRIFFLENENSFKNFENDFSKKNTLINLQKKYRKNLYSKNNFIKKNMHLLVPFGFIQNTGLKRVYSTSFQMKRRGIIFARLDKKRRRFKPFQLRYIKSLKNLLRINILNDFNMKNQKNLALKKINKDFIINYNYKTNKNLINNNNSFLKYFWLKKQNESQNNLINFYNPLNINNSFLINNFEEFNKNFLINDFSKFFISNLQTNNSILNNIKTFSNKQSTLKFKNSKKKNFNEIKNIKIKKKIFKVVNNLLLSKNSLEKRTKELYGSNPKIKKMFENDPIPGPLKDLLLILKPFQLLLNKIFKLKNNIFYKKKIFFIYSQKNFLTSIKKNLKLNFLNIKIKNNNKFLLEKLKMQYSLRKKNQKFISKKNKMISKLLPEPFKVSKRKTKNYMQWQSRNNARSLFSSFWLNSSYKESSLYYKKLKSYKFKKQKFNFFKYNSYFNTKSFNFLTSFFKNQLINDFRYKLLKRNYVNNNLKKNQNVLTVTNLITPYNLLFNNDIKLNLIYRLMNNNLNLYEIATDAGISPENSFKKISYKLGISKKILSNKIKAPYIEHKLTKAIIVDLPNPSKDFVKRNSLYTNHNNLYRLLK